MFNVAQHNMKRIIVAPCDVIAYFDFGNLYDFFFEWLRVDSEKEIVSRKDIKEAVNAGESSVRFFIDGLLRKERLIDYIENFILFQNQKENLKK